MKIANALQMGGITKGVEIVVNSKNCRYYFASEDSENLQINRTLHMLKNKSIVNFFSIGLQRTGVKSKYSHKSYH